MAKRCKESLAVFVDGIPRVVTAGQPVDDNDPVIKGREYAFEDIDTYVSRRVEQATAAPGELRNYPVTPRYDTDGQPGDPTRRVPAETVAKKAAVKRAVKKAAEKPADVVADDS